MPTLCRCLLLLLFLFAPLASAQTPQQERLAQQALKARKPGEAQVIDLRTDGARGKGAGITAEGDTAVIKDFKSTTPGANLGTGGPGAFGGGTEATVTAITSRINLWVIAGGALLGLGAYFQWFMPKKNADGSMAKAPDGTPIKGNPHLARIAFIAGGCLIAYGLMPVWLTVILIIGGILLVIAFAAVAITNPGLAAQVFAKGEALRAAAEAAAKLPPPVWNQWRANVAAAATVPTDVPMVEEVIGKDKLADLNAHTAAAS